MREQPAGTASHNDLLPPGETFAVWQLAKLLGCNRQHIVNLVEEGQLVAFDLRGPGSSRATLRVPGASVIALLEQRQVTATAEKRTTTRVRICPTKSRHRDPADALLTMPRPS